MIMLCLQAGDLTPGHNTRVTLYVTDTAHVNSSSVKLEPPVQLAYQWVQYIMALHLDKSRRNMYKKNLGSKQFCLPNSLQVVFVVFYVSSLTPVNSMIQALHRKLDDSSLTPVSWMIQALHP